MFNKNSDYEILNQQSKIYYATNFLLHENDLFNIGDEINKIFQIKEKSNYNISY